MNKGLVWGERSGATAATGPMYRPTGPNGPFQHPKHHPEFHEMRKFREVQYDKGKKKSFKNKETVELLKV